MSDGGRKRLLTSRAEQLVFLRWNRTCKMVTSWDIRAIFLVFVVGWFLLYTSVFMDIGIKILIDHSYTTSSIRIRVTASRKSRVFLFGRIVKITVFVCFDAAFIHMCVIVTRWRKRLVYRKSLSAKQNRVGVRRKRAKPCRNSVSFVRACVAL